MFVYQLPFTNLHAANVLIQLFFDYAIYSLFGGRAVAYFILSSFLAGSLHPCAGHFIAEHYVFNRSEVLKELAAQKKKGGIAKEIPPPETFSYYGPLNFFCYNVGLHNEHHDFPAVPWSRLPALHEIAKEFYADLPRHESWVWVLWQFVWDKEVGLWCRVKRKEGGRKVGGEVDVMGGNKAGEEEKEWRTEELGANVEEGVPGVK